MLTYDIFLNKFEDERNFLYKVNNILSTRKEIKIVDTFHSIAYTDMKTIFINFDKLQTNSKTYDDFLINLKGINYHELSHILFTRYGNINDSLLMMFLNILEDSRIENLFSKKYNKLVDYFKISILRNIVENVESNTQSNKKQEGLTFLLLYGRRLILNDNNLIKNFEKKFLEFYSQTILEETKKIIDEYLITLDVKRQIELAEKLKSFFNHDSYLIRNIMKSQKTTSYHERKVISKDEQKSTEEIKNDLNKKQNENEVNDNSSDSNPNDLKKDIEKKISEVKEVIREEIEKEMDIMKKYDFSSDSITKYHNIYGSFIPEQIHFDTAKKIEKRLKLLRNEFESKIRYNQKHGRIDLRRTIREKNNFNDFKKFLMSNINKTKIAVSILVDSSGSMDEYDYNIAIGSAWCISEALTKLDCDAEVIEFSHVFKILKKFGEKGNFGRNFGHSTLVNDSIIQATNDLLKNKIENKFIIVLTDGIFGDDKEKLLESLNICKQKNIRKYLLKVKEKIVLSDSLFNKALFIKDFNELENAMSKLIKDIQVEVILKIRSVLRS